MLQRLSCGVYVSTSSSSENKDGIAKAQGPLNPGSLPFHHFPSKNDRKCVHAATFEGVEMCRPQEARSSPDCRRLTEGKSADSGQSHVVAERLNLWAAGSEDIHRSWPAQISACAFHRLMEAVMKLHVRAQLSWLQHAFLAAARCWLDKRRSLSEGMMQRGRLLRSGAYDLQDLMWHITSHPIIRQIVLALGGSDGFSRDLWR